MIGAVISFNNADYGLLAVLLAYFTLPANLLIYGVNDIADFDTDALNPKKDEFENRLKKNEVRTLTWAILLTNLPFIILFIFILPANALLALIAWLFFGIFYSLKPIRAKAIPLIDGVFNILYALPGLIMFLAFADDGLNWLWLGMATLWCMGMHAYSAIPDIEADKKAGLSTVATVLGYNRTLLYAGFLMILPALVFVQISEYALFAVVAYFILIWRSRKKEMIFSMYKLFPLVNGLIGFMLFLVLLGERFGI